MTLEREGLIEAMAAAVMKSRNIIDALHAAEARSWVLAKLPENRRPRFDHSVPPEDGNAAEYWTDGYESAIDDIETLKLDEGESE